MAIRCEDEHPLCRQNGILQKAGVRIHRLVIASEICTVITNTVYYVKREQPLKN